MKNPPKRPEAPAGKQSVWVRTTYADIPVLVRGRLKIVKVLARKGHWRTVSISKRADAARERGSPWVPVGVYERELTREYDIVGADPIYRYHHATDVVKNLSPKEDPLHNLVWGKPFSQDNLKGSFQAMRLWYVVTDTNLNRAYLYGRTASFGQSRSGTPVVVDSLAIARDYATRLESEIVNEYDEKDYMELDRFVAWTVYGDTGVVKAHRRRARLSREKGFDFDEVTGKFRRTMTTWEKREVQKELQGPKYRYLPRVLTRDYGGNAKKFQRAMAALPKGERRRARRLFAQEVERMEKILEAKRRRHG